MCMCTVVCKEALQLDDTRENRTFKYYELSNSINKRLCQFQWMLNCNYEWDMVYIACKTHLWR